MTSPGVLRPFRRRGGVRRRLGTLPVDRPGNLARFGVTAFDRVVFGGNVFGLATYDDSAYAFDGQTGVFDSALFDNVVYASDATAGVLDSTFFDNALMG